MRRRRLVNWSTDKEGEFVFRAYKKWYRFSRWKVKHSVIIVHEPTRIALILL